MGITSICFKNTSKLETQLWFTKLLNYTRHAAKSIRATVAHIKQLTTLRLLPIHHN